MKLKQYNPKQASPKHIIIKLLKAKDKEKTLKASKENWHIISMENNDTIIS